MLKTDIQNISIFSLKDTLTIPLTSFMTNHEPNVKKVEGL